MCSCSLCYDQMHIVSLVRTPVRLAMRHLRGNFYIIANKNVYF